MKVVCIKEVKNNPTPLTPIIIAGEYYTVIKNLTYPEGLYYELEEDRSAAYHSQLFAPVSEIDETTFERNYKKESV